MRAGFCCLDKIDEMQGVEEMRGGGGRGQKGMIKTEEGASLCVVGTNRHCTSYQITRFFWFCWLLHPVSGEWH